MHAHEIDETPIAPDEAREQEQGALAPLESEGGGAGAARRSEASVPAAPPQGVAPLVALLASGQLRREDVEDAMALQKQHDEYEAKKAYTAAMARFREIVPTARRSGNNTHLRSRYATRDDIAAAVDRPLSECGMNYRFRTAQQGYEALTITCVLTHSAGHFEEESMTLPIEEAKGVTLVQRIGIAEEYGKRRTLSNITGVSTGENDADGAAPPELVVETASEQQCQDIATLLADAEGATNGTRDRFMRAYLRQYGPAENDLGIAMPARAVAAAVRNLQSVIDNAEIPS